MRASQSRRFLSVPPLPSISTDDQYTEKVTECGHWLVEKLTQSRFVRQTLSTPGHPVVWRTTNKKQAAAPF